MMSLFALYHVRKYIFMHTHTLDTHTHRRIRIHTRIYVYMCKWCLPYMLLCSGIKFYRFYKNDMYSTHTHICTLSNMIFLICAYIFLFLDKYNIIYKYIYVYINTIMNNSYLYTHTSSASIKALRNKPIHLTSAGVVIVLCV